MGMQAIPWSLYRDDETRFWVHIGLVILGFLLSVITLIAQWAKPAPYGKHEGSEAGNWGPMIPQRLGHIFSDAIPGVLMFILVFYLYGDSRGTVNYIFLALWLCHYIHRGIIHPLTMRYRSGQVALGITLGGFFPNCLFHFLNADFIGSAVYASNYYYDPRFICGIVIFVLGFVINRWADYKLRSLRRPKTEDGKVMTSLQTNVDGDSGYFIPRGGLYEVISCPNYFGELVEWLGWSLATWSLAGLVWALFGAATFLPRSWHNHNWYKRQFEDYPSQRKALIPFIY
ncbi:3-oxo-5-alpha-steroid 4-dehydrogenase 1-like isoform X1 [Mya arenaria]|uniref:3-oxo-5-alpha-steroid 4-dehydrogenase 1-like isoform X1 n=1 Tax=Mya arenaria TaxID=6604 RepID=UPI0022E8C306|nr:3-oxo-5-alpha-steroid 4-dehydrogenase 1-like isoform X1 [Mya arenaria]